MKAILYFTLVHRYSGGEGYAVFGVTSESGRSRINGRLMAFSEPIHIRRTDMLGKFDTEEAAQAKIERVKTIRENFRPLIANAENAVRTLRNQRAVEIDAELAVTP